MEDAHTTILKMVHGYKVSRVLGSLAEIGLADQLAPGESKSVESLAKACDVDAGRLLRVIRLMCAHGVFELDPVTSHVRHTPLSLYLCSDHAQTIRYEARCLTDQGSWRGFEPFTDGLRGAIPHVLAWGMTRFQYLGKHPEEARAFDQAHAGDSRHQNISSAYEFPAEGVVVDIGGGNGELLRQILQRRSGVTGVLFDQAHVLARLTPEQLMGGRIAPVSGSFFDAVPGGGDIYLLTKILHDWSDEDAVRILRNVQQAMKSRSRVLINEMLIDPDPAQGQLTHYYTDVQMMAVLSGCERTQDEFVQLLSKAHLRWVRTVAADTISILEAEIAS